MTYAFDKCGGCFTCELSCSFRRNGSFNHHESLIRVVEDGQHFCLRFATPEETGGPVCDGCADLEEPACAKFCHDPAKLAEIIREHILDRKEQSHE